jgi:hypothetical protein
MHVNIYLTTVIGSGYGNKMLNSHHFVIKNPNPMIRSLAHDVTGSVRFTIVGANVSEALAMLRQRYPLNVDLARAFTEFLDSENILYKVHSHNLADELEEVLQHENFIVDRSDESDAKVSAKLVRLMQFGITSEKSGEQAPADIMESVPMPAHRPSRPQKKTGSDDSDSDDSSASTRKAGSADSDSEDDDDSEGLPAAANDEIEENIRATMLFQPDMATATQPLPLAAGQRAFDADDRAPQYGPRRITDVIAFNSSSIPKKRGLGCLAYAYPTLFPYGCGGFDQRREVHMSERQWALRFLRLHGRPGRRNSQHYGALATIFDQIAMVKAFRAQNVSMRVKEEAITQFGLWKKEDVSQCMAYKEDVEERARRGLKPLPPPEKIKTLLSMIDMVKPGLSKRFVGADIAQDGTSIMSFQLPPYGSWDSETSGPDIEGPTVEGVTYGRQRLPMAMIGTAIALRLRSQDERGWRLMRAAIDFILLRR